MEFANELRLPGQIGHLAVIVAFIAAVFSAVSYFISAQSKNEQEITRWRNMGRVLFAFHSVAIISIVGALFYIIQNHRFEYHYAWEHSSLNLPPKYLLACFWEGQEGSFLLWMFWDMVLGAILIFSSKRWEAPVFTVFMIVQAFLASMLLGIYIGDIKIGSTPFILLRDSMVDAPVFKRADYLSFIKDGNGLNPLLQNYWMVIHPPVLFMGFASTLVPFAFAIAALWKNDFTGWLDSALPWALFSGAVLGAGIMLGGAWAYESLSFGGYWAWDPVENTSLVPWIILVAGIHTLLAFKKTGHSLRITFVFFILTFILVLYSTFLTRSGVLGNTSVHAFTDLGMSGQLLIYMLTVSVPPVILLLFRWRKIPSPVQEENIYSREFWIFVGSLVLLLSAIQITFTTSIPVYNKIFGTNIAPPTDVVQHFNRWQLPIAIIIALLSTAGLYMKFRKPDVKQFWKRISVVTAITVVVTAISAWTGNITYPTYVALLFAGLFSVVGNVYYFIIVLSGKWKVSGPAVAHLGFGLMVVGILFSSANKHTISFNYRGIDYGSAFKDKALNENQYLPKGSVEHIGNYTVTYLGDSAAAPNFYYKVLFERKDTVTGKMLERFYLYPNAQINPKMGLISSPDTKHYLGHDVYTHVTSVPDRSTKDEIPDENKFRPHSVSKGDTIFTSNSYAVLESIERIEKSDKVDIKDGDLAVGAKLKVYDMNGNQFDVEPIYFIQDNHVDQFTDKIGDMGLTFRLTRIIPDENKVQIDVAEEKPENDYIIIKAIVFPQINLLWLGTIIMIAGFLISIFRIWQKKRKSKSSETAV